MNNKLFLDIHVIQTVPPSNINRDDTGSPKTAQYGGVTRARVSSQSWKRAMRHYFNEHGDQSNVGIRSLEIVKYLADEILLLKPEMSENDALELANKTLNDAKISTKDNKAKALFFLGAIQAKKLAEAAIIGNKSKDELQTILNDNIAIDIALFGRMVADDPTLNADASAQIAHSISTHAVQAEFDFFTASDDLSPKDNAGAGMLGTIEYNSSTLYRYGNVAIHDLLSQLKNKEATVRTLSLFIEAFSNSMPTGKVNTFANQTLPQAIVVTVRKDRPVNLVSGFEVPTKSSSGFVTKSIEKLKGEFQRAEKFVKQPVLTLTLGVSDLGVEENSLDKLLETFSERVSSLIPAE